MAELGRGLFIIPAYNEAGRVGAVVTALRERFPDTPVAVVDDGSTDDTARHALAAGAHVLPLPANQGYGVALQAGYQYAYEHGSDYVVQLDADGQHDPGSIPDLLEALNEPGVDVVIGSRYRDGGNYRAPFFRRVGQRLFRALLNAITRGGYTDPTSGFQAISRRALWFYTSKYFPYDYPDADVIVMLHRAGLRCVEVPVKIFPSPPGKTSMHSGCKPFYYIARMFLSLGLTLIRPRPVMPRSRYEEAP